ncbi:hypothetical protein [Methylopila turkensis]|uniref:Uncharacterized protein n=1 Tax=Methylopila turkensis TaxID=1437816 RepID=A0A9W6JPR6_9HYPH|nr:hypothetical protein [Methylopila turkensis]GLK81022.1 hypothetical protein GCM10008174_27630 [Methylopila turkensis]
MDLVLLVCLAASPQTCREEHVAMTVERTDPRLCMASAVPAIVEWTESNPEWQVTRWTCGPASRAAALDQRR